MAIQVEGYGNITQGNAKEIYTAWKRGEVDLNKAQQTKCESFLTPEELDEVQYDEKTSEKRGKNSIDTENTKDNGNGTEGAATGVSVAASAGTVTTAIMAIKAGEKVSDINGFCALIAATAAVLCSAATLVLALMFDNQLGDRKNHSQNAANDNQTMDTYTENLAGTMEMMNEDVETYNEQQDVLTRTVNTQASQGADLQMQIDAAMAMGDTKKAQSLKEQLKALQEQDNSQLEDDLAETGGAIEEYRAMNIESAGCAESGQTVSDFLKDGKPKGTMAMICGALCAVGAIAAGIAAIKSGVPKIWTPFGPVDLAPGLGASIMWGAIGAVLGTASGLYFSKGAQENECGNNGEEMQDHVNSLNDMIEQQTAYTDDTKGQFEESDEAASESKSDASEKAGEAVSGHKDGLGNKPKEEKPEGTGAAA